MDFLLGFVGLCMATASAYLPFYVYTHTDEFGPPTMAYAGRDTSLGELVSNRETPLFKELDSQIDRTTTGSIKPSSNSEEASAREDNRGAALTIIGPPAIDVPSKTTGFDLVFASRGRALIRDGNDIIPVAIGSQLPDGSYVESILKSDGQWRLITSKNTRLTMN